MMLAAQRGLAALAFEPSVRGPWRQTLRAAACPDRGYEGLTKYVAHRGASAADAAVIARRLNVVIAEHGIIAAAYTVDDEALGDAWREAYDVDVDSLGHVANAVDTLCADVFAACCADDAAKHNPQLEPLQVGVDVLEVAAFGCDCSARRAVELAIEFSSDAPADDEAKEARSEFPRKRLLPAIMAAYAQGCAGPATPDAAADDAEATAASTRGDVGGGDVGAAPSGGASPPSSGGAGGDVRATLLAAATCLVDERAEAVADRNLRAAFVGFSKWLRSEAPFRVRAKGTGVIVARPGGLRAQEFVCDYLGDVYAPWQWFEKQSAMLAGRRLVGGPAASANESFHNIALERPQRDAQGYALLFVDAGGGRANLASSLSHSCDGNVATCVFVRPCGALSVALHTTRPVALGEELCMDYSAATSSEDEWRSAVCLCGASACRGAYVELANSNELCQCLDQNHGPLETLAVLLRAARPLAPATAPTATAPGVASEGRRVSALLSRHGFGDAFFERDTTFGVSAAAQKCESKEDLPSSSLWEPQWLERFVAGVVTFVEFERGKLPFMLMRDSARAGGVAAAGDDLLRASLRARLVLEQRVQALACAVSLARGVGVRGGCSEAPPLETLDRDGAAAVLRAVLRGLVVTARRALAHPKFSAPKVGRALADALTLAAEAAQPDGGGSSEAPRWPPAGRPLETAAECRAALLEVRASLLSFSEYPWEAGLAAKETRERAAWLEAKARAAAAADAVLLLAHTKNFFRPDRARRDRGDVVSQPVGVRACDVADVLPKDAKVGTLAHAATRAAADDVVVEVERRYGAVAEVEALLRWHDLDALVEPRLGDGALLARTLAGCAVLPDPAEIVSKLLHAGDAYAYGDAERRLLAGVLADHVKQAHPWPETLQKAFCLDAAAAKRKRPPKDAAGEPAAFGSPAVLSGALPAAAAAAPRPRDFVLGSPALDAKISDCSGLDRCVAALRETLIFLDEAPAEHRERADLLADAVPAQPPSKWVACDGCSKWRIVPWHARVDDEAPFHCRDQAAWGAAADEACCAAAEAPFGENDVVVAASGVPHDAIIVGLRCDVLCCETGVWFEAKIADGVLESDGDKVKRARAHFNNWASKFDQWLELPRELDRVAPHRTFSAANAQAQKRAKGGAEPRRAAPKRKSAAKRKTPPAAQAPKRRR